MKLGKVVFVSLTALLLFAGLAKAQDYEGDIEQSTEQFREYMEAMADFVKDVNFDENDIKNTIAYWDEIQSFGDDGDSAMEYEGEEDEEMIDFDELLAHPEYRSWAMSKGFDPDEWLKKFMRIQAAAMKKFLGAVASEGRAQMEGQFAELETQRGQLGEEAYQQMKQAMEAGAAAIDSAEAGYKYLPEPTPSEKALIERYGEQLMNLQ